MNNTITPQERLRIASEQMAGMQSHGYVSGEEMIVDRIAQVALQMADELIKQAGCVVQDSHYQSYDTMMQSVHKEITSPANGMMYDTRKKQEPVNNRDGH